MEYQKIINLLDDTTNEPSKFRTRNWVKINDESKWKYLNSNIRFKTSMIRSSLCDYNDEYVLVKGTITVRNTEAAKTKVNNTNKKVIFKNCAPFTDCVSTINNTQVDDAQKIDEVIPMYNLIEYSYAYSKTSGSLWKYYGDEPALNNNGRFIDFPDNNNNNNNNNNINNNNNNNNNNNVHLRRHYCHLISLDFDLPSSSLICALHHG